MSNVRVLNVCIDDWANFSHDNAKALRSVGIDCVDVKINKHIFNYQTESTLMDWAGVFKEVGKADVVQIMHSCAHTLLAIKPYLNGKRLFVVHAGTVYRQHHVHLNSVFDPYVEKSIIALGEFATLCEGATYVVGAVDTDKFQPNYILGNRGKIVGHYPSNANVKGTGTIDQMVARNPKRGDFQFRYNTGFVDHAEVIKRYAGTDIYIELFAPLQAGKPYGSWGITALEVAAMGKVCITNHTWKDVYEDAYGDIGLAVANTEEEFQEQLSRFISMTSKELREEQLKTRSWVKLKHSYKATGTRYLEEIL